LLIFVQHSLPSEIDWPRHSPKMKSLLGSDLHAVGEGISLAGP
jgi:hypothetical protein